MLQGQRLESQAEAMGQASVPAIMAGLGRASTATQLDLHPGRARVVSMDQGQMDNPTAHWLHKIPDRVAGVLMAVPKAMPRLSKSQPPVPAARAVQIISVAWVVQRYQPHSQAVPPSMVFLETAMAAVRLGVLAAITRPKMAMVERGAMVANSSRPLIVNVPDPGVEAGVRAASKAHQREAVGAAMAGGEDAMVAHRVAAVMTPQIPRVQLRTVS